MTTAPPVVEVTPPEPPEGLTGKQRKEVTGGASVALVLSALGIVFGDIGTSPLYAVQTVFALDNGLVKPNPTDVYGVLSFMFWSISLVVSAKYVMTVMRADNDGEGGVMALAALTRRLLGESSNRAGALMLLGVLGASLFYGDSLITPAISVLSAVEGLKVPFPSLSNLVIPIALVIIGVLFAGQRFGTAKVGKLFGPVMVVWFVVLAALGVRGISNNPSILKAINPVYMFTFVFDHPYVTFIAMGAIVLCITGAEALYADMGHFGRAPIKVAWFLVAFPCLVLNYLGQGALILAHPSSISNPFFLLVPEWGQVPMVVLATLATVIASQSVISGAFSVTLQASRLGFLPRLRVKQTNEESSGQVYLPAVNVGLLAGVVALTLLFRSAESLAIAYGIAVTGTLLITTGLFLVVARLDRGWSVLSITVAAVVVGGLELAFFLANLTKFVHGGYLPLTIAGLLFFVMTTWQAGRRAVTANRLTEEGSLKEFILSAQDRSILRVPGVAVFPHPGKETTPLAMKLMMEDIGVLPAHVIVVSALAVNSAHVPLVESLEYDDLDFPDDGICYLQMRHGFADEPDIPAGLEAAKDIGMVGDDVDTEAAFYYLSRATIRSSGAPGMRRFRKAVFISLSRRAVTSDFGLPTDRTVVMGKHVHF